MKKRCTIFFAIVLGLLIQKGYSQNLQWAKGFGGNGLGESSSSIAVDASGNVYTTGYFWGTVDFDPGPGSFTLTSTGNTDIYVQKLDANGNFLWAGNMGSVADDNGNCIVVDGTGNMYIVGLFSTTADFDPGPGTFSLITPGGSYDAFIVKLNASGALVWAKRMGGTGTDEAFGIFVDGTGNIYTTGKFAGTADFDPGSGTTNLVSAGSADIFIQKLNSAGNFTWAKSIGSAAADYGHKVTVDASGNVIATGYFQAIADFDPGLTTANLTSSGLEDAFIVKLDASGNYVWARALGGAATDEGNSIDTDPAGNVYTTGVFTGVADMDPGLANLNFVSNGLKDIFVHKLDAAGLLVWAKQMGGGSDDNGNSIYADANNVYVAGDFNGTVDFDPGSGTANLNSSTGGGTFIQKLSVAGNYNWALNFNGNSALSHTVDPAGIIYITGTFGGTSDMDPGTGVTNLTANGTSDIYALKLNPLSLGLIDNNRDQEVLFFPNPSKDNLMIDMGKEFSEVKIEIMDATGKIVFSQKEDHLSKTEINFKAVPGIYFMMISTPEFKKTMKVIKQ